MAFFFFGTLRDGEVLARVLDRSPAHGELLDARLSGVRSVRARNAPYPVIVPAPSSTVPGSLLPWPRPRDERRIRWFEEDDYVERWEPVSVDRTGRQQLARVFIAVASLGATTDEWDFEHWVAHEKEAYLAQCDLWLRDCPF